MKNFLILILTFAKNENKYEKQKNKIMYANL